MMRPAALVLAGGAARRLGGVDKPLLTLRGRTVLEHILETLAGQAGPIALSANGDPDRFAGFGLPVLDDGALVGEGPLAGVLAGLEWAAAGGHATLLTVPGDTPFIPADLVARLTPGPSCAASAGQAHHLVALWPVAARDALRRWLSTPGPRGVRQFSAKLGQRQIVFSAVASDPFLNVNTVEDLAKARAVADGWETGGKP